MDSQEHVDVVLAEIAAEVAKKRRQELEKSLEQVKSKQFSNHQQPDGSHPTSTVATDKKKKVKVRTAVSPPQGGARSGKLGPHTGVVGDEGAVGEPGPVLAHLGVEAVGPGSINCKVVLRFDPLQVGAEAAPARQVHRGVHAHLAPPGSWGMLC